MSLMAYPLNLSDYNYNAKDVMLFHTQRSSGVISTDDLEVSVDSGMTLKLSPGRGWLSNGLQYGIPFWAEETQYFDDCTADTALNVVALAIVKWETTIQDNVPLLEIRQSTPASNPVVPTIYNSGEYTEIALAKIYIPAGTTALTNDMITDLREDADYCGIVTDGIAVKSEVPYEESFSLWLNQIKETAESLPGYIFTTQINDLNTSIANLNTKYAEGMTIIANMVTENGVTTDPDADYETIATNISLINPYVDPSPYLDKDGLRALDWTEEDIAMVSAQWGSDMYDYYKVNEDLITLWDQIKELTDEEIYASLQENIDIVNWYPKFNKFYIDFNSYSNLYVSAPEKLCYGIPSFTSEATNFDYTFCYGRVGGSYNAGYVSRLIAFEGDLSSGTSFNSSWLHQCKMENFKADMSNATTLSNTWEYCASLKNFEADLRNVTTQTDAWSGCGGIEVFNANLDSLTDFSTILANLLRLKELTIKLNSVTTLAYMFKSNTNLEKIDIEATSATSGYQMCYYNYTLKSFSGDLSSATTLYQAWYSCYSLKEFNADISSATELYHAFTFCSSLESFSGTIAAGANLYGTWESCINLKNFDADVSGVTKFYRSWYSCDSLETFEAETSNATNFYYAWSSCSSLKTLNVNLDNATDLQGVIEHTSMTSFIHPNTTKCTAFNNAFNSCTQLETVKIDTSSTSTFSGAFNNCTALVTAEINNLAASIDLSDSPLLSVDSMVYIFTNAQTVSSRTITLGETNLAKLTDAQKAIATGKGWTLA